eukprot:6835287-Prymnesium_polylepis.1
MTGGRADRREAPTTAGSAYQQRACVEVEADDGRQPRQAVGPVLLRGCHIREGRAHIREGRTSSHIREGRAHIREGRTSSALGRGGSSSLKVSPASAARGATWQRPASSSMSREWCRSRAERVAAAAKAQSSGAASVNSCTGRGGRVKRWGARV